MKLTFKRVPILLNKSSESWNDALRVLLELLPCFQVAAIHHNRVDLELVSQVFLVITNEGLGLQRHQVFFIELVKVVFTDDISAMGESLVRKSNPGLGQGLERYHILVLFYVVLNILSLLVFCSSFIKLAMLW